MEKVSLTGYKRFIYQGWVTEGLKAGMPVEEAIEKAQAKLNAIPKVNIRDGDNPLAEEYFDAQNRTEAVNWLTSLNGGQ